MHPLALVPLFLPAALVGPVRPGPDAESSAQVALQALLERQPGLGLSAALTAYKVRNVVPDGFLNGDVVRIDQYYQGVRVLGGEAVVQVRQGGVRALVETLRRDLRLDPHPSILANEALALAQKALAPRGPYANPPTAELLIVPLKTGPALAAPEERLVYRVHLELENGTAETSHTDFFIDAHTGAILKQWDSLRTESALGLGKSQYSGLVKLNTHPVKQAFELRDTTRGIGGNTVLDLGQNEGIDGTIYTHSTNTWGDGENYSGGATTSENGQTAAVDAAYGLQRTWDYYRDVHHFKGIDGKGTATRMRVHYGTAYDNAFWSDSCFCMTFGDGSRFKSLEALDVIGHEMSHGVCANTANLEYDGESGGLNEANSDIQGAMVEFHARAGASATIGESGGNWTMGEDLQTAKFSRPLRYMYKPSKDGMSADAWYEELGSLNVHYSSGPMNRCFFFLSQGASANPDSDYNAPGLPQGMTGLGNDKSARIWFRAMTTYMTALTDYAQARAACISAVKDLYGAGGSEEQAVWNAFHGINVGPAWPLKPREITVTIQVPPQALVVPHGTCVAFTGRASDSAPNSALTYTWIFGDGAIASKPTTSHTFRNPGSSPLRFKVTFKVQDDSGSFANATRYITVTPARR